ncbi:MAG: hypothetical protein QOH25_3130 [Acidobacteriota bacterium]|jgi:hypothetical protein|nr:hypothetical protein [Acidobacteriota bacterium]
MTLATTIFAPLLELLASQTANEAKIAGEPRFEYDTQGKPTDYISLLAFNMGEVGSDVMSRLCCALGGSTSSSVGISELAPDRSDERHQYRAKSVGGLLPGGGRVGYVYTRRGGFIDLGHARDYIDYTRFFASRYRDLPLAGASGELAKLFNEAGDIHLIIAPRSEKPLPVLAAIMGAKLAYERSIWHEIVTYFPDTLTTDQKFSSFAPEDNFSNAVGVLAGYQAVLTPTVDFNTAADQALFKVLQALGPATKEVTDEATDYVEDFWWESGLLGGGLRPNALRRNFDATPPVKPWLVSEIAIPGDEAQAGELRSLLGRPTPASIPIPTHYNGLLLDNLAHLEITNIHSSIKAVLPSNLAQLDRIKSSDLYTVVNAIRAKERQEKGNDADSPGPPVP